ncbi:MULTISPECIES: ABC transporter ATP-binding protein/permease [unclassified Azospirillum]|uniref:ABC transporter ATP-binding protein/permease n=1 Tax=unclassified Azospirillum TaxID=2630922 RepID=UPI000B73D8C3|nr:MULTISPECIES: ATP-binding cassette domain-containing protein [unclassified Azospirillum]SNS67534.1 putative ATP-binding cassette transporter [Azospirillum sp. RU38E]SNS85787.1 putative ATP-binding cassette transporter [Azospirillum sp. RU37A]
MTDSYVTDPSAQDAVITEKPPEVPPGTVWLHVKYGAAMIWRYIKADPLLGIPLIAYQFFQSTATVTVLLKMQLGFSAIVNALAAKNGAVISGIVLEILLYGFGLALLNVIGAWTRLALRMRMRKVLTTRLLDGWMAGNRFFHLERRTEIDYPEQRIQEDVYTFVEKVTIIGVSVVASIFGVFLYTSELWRLSPPLVFDQVGLTEPIPGLLVYVAFALAIGMTFLVHWVGRLLTRAEVVRQRLEAQFRLEMQSIRGNGESIAFARAGGIERKRLANTFQLIILNWRSYTLANMRITLVTGLPETFMFLFPYLICIPFVLEDKMQIGDIQIVMASFTAVYMGISAIVTQYSELAILRSAVARLHLFDQLLTMPLDSGIHVEEIADERVGVQGLKVAYPNGEPMVSLDRLEIAPGQRLLVQGKSGAGKSTLLRSIAGLWPYGAGDVQVPTKAKIAFLPQRNYMPDGTLASLMSYPDAPEAHGDDDYVALLGEFGLGRLAPQLHSYQPWSRILSPGEQQRVAAARAILARPDFLFVDEATSALDAQLEEKLYKVLVERLPGAAIISVAHRQSVAVYHDRSLIIENGVAMVKPLHHGTA